MAKFPSTAWNPQCVCVAAISVISCIVSGLDPEDASPGIPGSVVDGHTIQAVPKGIP